MRLYINRAFFTEVEKTELDKTASKRRAGMLFKADEHGYYVDVDEFFFGSLSEGELEEKDIFLVTIEKKIDVVGSRTIGEYEFGTAKCLLDSYENQGKHFAVKIQGPNVKDVFELYRRIRIGDILPTQSYALPQIRPEIQDSDQPASVEESGYNPTKDEFVGNP